MFADLSRYPFAEVLRRLSASQKSGDLEVRDARVAKTVFVDRGRVVFAASNQDEDRLGDILLSIGRISQDDFDTVSRLMKSGAQPIRFGDALVLAGLMDRNELGRSLARQVRNIVRSLFVLESGAASFAERKPTIPLEYMVGVSVHRMLYAGVGSMVSTRLIRLGLGDLDRPVRRVEVPPFRFATYKCTKPELEILDRCREPTPIRELVVAEKRASVSRLRAVYAMHASGVIEDAQPDAYALKLVPHPETGTFLLSVADPSPPSRAEAVRLEVIQELEFSSHLDPEAWARASDSSAVEQALQDKLERLCLLHESVVTDPELLRDLEIVLGRTAAALHRARNLGTVQSAMTRMSGVASADSARDAAAARSPKTEPAIALPPPPEPPIALPPPPAERTPIPAPPPPARQPPKARPASRQRSVPEAKTTPPLPVPPPAPRAPAVPPQADPARSSPTTIPPAPEPVGVDRVAQQLIATAQLRLQVRNNAGAVDALRELVAHAPGVAEHRLRLARAMSSWVPTVRQAEREYLQAVRLEPENPQAHYEFAKFYERLKFRGRALAELRTALQLDPGYAAARALLEQLSPREAATTLPERGDQE